MPRLQSAFPKRGGSKKKGQEEEKKKKCKKSKGVLAKTLSKIWRIDLQEAKKTLKCTTQMLRCEGSASLSWNYSTNDRMLQYKQLNEHFFMDMFFATKSMARSSRESVLPVQMSVPSIPVRRLRLRCGGKASSRRASNTDTRAKTSLDATSDEL